MTRSTSRLSRSAFLQLAAFAVLIIGLGLAVRIDQASRRAEATAPDQDTLAAAALAPGDSKRYDYQMGQLSGNIGVLFGHFVQAASSLAHGRPLAVVIALASFAAAGGLLVAADKARL